MDIPNNLTKADLIKGADKIIKEGIPKNANSSTYDVIYEGQLLPPKLIVSYANIFKNGMELDRNGFKGGLNTDCFMLLKENGFDIIKKDNIYSILLRFLEQANEGGLKTAHLPKKLKGFDCKISFGQGVQAKIPWISLLRKPHTTSHGIYPVYLFYKEIDKLILAFGISETNTPVERWNIDNPKPISQYFMENGLGKPDRYGASYVFKVYDTNNLPDANVLEDDLDAILKVYTEESKIEENSGEQNDFDQQEFVHYLLAAGLIFNEKLVNRFIASLLTKPFVLLSGLSGSGKTKLAQAFVQWICQDDSQFCIVPVGADWTNREPLVGYVNALSNAEYILPENGALKLIIDANENGNRPYFLILDEMNLSHVERYFSDFLSMMESKEKLRLHSSDTPLKSSNGIEVAKEYSWPSNLFIIGTVNIDETTYMFSPKVLDRANAIEFRVTKGEIEYFFSNHQEVDMKSLVGQGVTMAQSFLALSENKVFETLDLTGINKTLVSFFEQLKKVGAEFGYRSATEIIRLINQLTVIAPELQEAEKLDIAIMQKLLPKLHGSRRKLCPVLLILGGFCVDNQKIDNIEKLVFSKSDFDFESEGVLYPIALEKITRMYKGAMENGFASYAEA